MTIREAFTYPDTNCPTCFSVERTNVLKVIDLLLPNPNKFWSAYATAFGSFGRTWQEKHRALYADTGDPMELIRMLRHIK